MFYLRHLLSSTFFRNVFFKKQFFEKYFFIELWFFARRRVSFTPTKRCWRKRNTTPRKKQCFIYAIFHQAHFLEMCFSKIWKNNFLKQSSEKTLFCAASCFFYANILLLAEKKHDGRRRAKNHNSMKKYFSKKCFSEKPFFEKHISKKCPWKKMA